MDIAVLFRPIEAAGIYFTQEDAKRIRQAVPGCRMEVASSAQNLIARAFKAEVLLCWGTDNLCIADDYCRYAADTLQWIHVLSAGVEGILSAAGNIPGIRITNSSGIHGAPMADQVMAYVLAFLRRLPELERNRNARLWAKELADETYGKTLLILGAGNIGAVVAQRAKAFSMTVLGIRRNPRPMEWFDGVYSETDTDRLLPEADFVLMLLPYNLETDGFMTRERFGRMKQNSYFINVGRGKTVCEEALIDALRTQHLAGAALDTVASEPLSIDSPLWELPNVIITPHTAANSPLYMTRAIDKFIRNCICYAQGCSLESPVDPQARY